jgi:hypothetical protein
MSKKILLLVLLPLNTLAAPLGDFTFKSPAFNGNGYSSHVLTIENQEHTRQKTVRDQIQAELDKVKADKANTNLAKFMNNLESRIYAQISQNLASQMFANGGSSSGTLNFEGNTIYWEKDPLGQWVKMQVTGPGVDTTITIPLGQWQF